MSRGTLTGAQARRVHRLYESGAAARDLAARFHVSEMTVSRIVRGLSWSSETGGRDVSRTTLTRAGRAAYIQGRADQGCGSAAQIARELGVSRQAVCEFMRRHGLSLTAAPAAVV